jgi:hypothetical protein
MTTDERDDLVIPPDPVIEYYKQFVDRAALRENLKLTVEERLEKLQRWADEQARQAGHSRTDRPQPLAVREEPAACASDLTVDPVVEVYKHDVDRTLLRERLKLTVDQRLRDLEQFQADVRELQRAGRERK